MTPPTNNRHRAKLETILASLGKRSSLEVVNDIRGLAKAMADGEGDALLVAEPDLLGYRALLHRAYREAITDNEISQSRQLLATDTDDSFLSARMGNPLLSHVYDRSGAMLAHLDFTTCRRLVLVGCGWIPVTLFFFHDKTEVRELIGLDIVEDAVETAGNVARRYGYTRAAFQLMDGYDYDYRDAQIVYIVGVVSRKSAVLSRIAETAPANAQVVVNEPYSLGHLWHESVEPFIDERFEIIARGAGSGTVRNLVLRLRAGG